MDSPSAERLFRYKAFISYSHAHDKALATALQSGLGRFAKPWYKLRAMRAFRDDTNLAVNPALWSRIREALNSSEYLLLFASPAAAASRWIRDETDFWINNRAPQKLLILLTDGEIVWNRDLQEFDWDKTTALPPGLRNAFSEEPYFLDLREFVSDAEVSLDNPLFRNCVASISSTLIGLRKDDWIGEDVRQHRITKWIVFAVVACLTVLTTVAIWQWNQALLQARQARAHELVAGAREALSKNDSELAVALSVKASETFESSPLVARALAQAAYYNPGSRMVYAGHTDEVVAISVSADGRYLASGSKDKTVAIWEIDSGTMLGRLEGHQAGVNGIAFSADAGRLLSASNDGTIRLWDTEKTSAISVSAPRAAPYHKVIFGPREESAITISGDGSVEIWQLPDLRKVTPIFRGSGAVLSMAMSQDQRQLIFGTADNLTCRYLIEVGSKPECRNDEQIHRIRDVALDAANSVVFSAAGTWDCAIAARSTEHGKLGAAHCFDRYEAAQNAIALHPKNRLLLSGSEDHAVLLWRVRKSGGAKVSFDGSVARRYQAHSGQITDVAFVPGQDRFLSASQDSTVRLWDMPNASETLRFDRFDANGFAVTPDGETALLTYKEREGGDFLVHKIQLQTGYRSVLPSTFKNAVGPLAITPDDQLLIAASAGNLVAIGIDAGKIVRRFSSGHKHYIVTSLSVSNDGRFVLSSSYPENQASENAAFRDMLLYWDLASGTVRYRLDRHRATVRAAAIGPEGRIAVSADNEGKIFVWNLLEEGRFEREVGEARSPVLAVAFSRDGRYLVSGGGDHVLRLWSTTDWRLIREYSGHKGSIDSVAVASDGKRLLSGSRDGSIRLWDLLTGDEIAVVSGSENLKIVREVGFIGQTDDIYTRSWDGSARLWRIERPADLLRWVQENRFIREFTLPEKRRYRIEN